MRTLLIGRWQPPHLGHIKIVKDACKHGEVIIAIGSAQKVNTLANPFSAGERIEMWKRVLDAENIRAIFVTVPDAPDHRTWVDYVKIMCPQFDRIVAGDQLSKKLLSEAGFRVDAPEFLMKEVLSGTSVRDLIVKGDKSWKKLVPKQVVEYLEEIHGEERLKGIARG